MQDNGASPREGLLDCMIAAVAWREGASLLTQDIDLVRIANVTGIELDAASPSAVAFLVFAGRRMCIGFSLGPCWTKPFPTDRAAT